jgi:hypothetical protein
MMQMPNANARNLKNWALHRDNHLCVNCGLEAKCVHHIVPLSLGGFDVLGNLASLCLQCHGVIHDRDFVKQRNCLLRSIQKRKDRGEPLGGRPRSYTLDQADACCVMQHDGYSVREIAEHLKLSRSVVGRILAEATQIGLEA